MEQELFEFIWDQSKKNTDKDLIGFLVKLRTETSEDKKDLIDQINDAFKQIEDTGDELRESLCKEIDELRHSLTDRMDEIEKIFWQELGRVRDTANDDIQETRHHLFEKIEDLEKAMIPARTEK